MYSKIILPAAVDLPVFYQEEVKVLFSSNIAPEENFCLFIIYYKPVV